MKLPEGVTEKEAIDTVEHCLRILAPKYVFGSNDVDDMKQIGWVFAIDLLGSGRYDRSRGPLANMMYQHLKNRYGNYLRDHHHRPISDVACLVCREFLQGIGEGHPDGLCKVTAAWLKRNAAKATLSEPESLAPPPGIIGNEDSNPALARYDDPAEKAASNDLFALIDQKLPLELRVYYLKMQSGVTVTRNYRIQVQEAVRKIMIDAGLGEMVPEEDD